MTTVREATLDVLRRCDMHRIFANPGSTEVAFLADLPDDLEFVLGLHEGSVVGMATGHAIATGRPAFVNLHTTAGLGNAVGALATARVNRAPLVVVVGQQDRRHLALEPFLAGRLEDLAGPYPVWVNQPVLPQDVPAAVHRAWHEAAHHRGPAIVVVPMDDWSAPVDPALGLAAPAAVRRASSAPGPAADEVARLLAGANPVIVVGAGADDRQTWDALVRLVERLGAPVWQEAFGARAGFPQDHPRFAGHLPAGRSGLRSVLAGHDVALVVGTGAFRQYPFEPGPLVPHGLTVVVVSDDPDELHHSRADLAVFADPAAFCAALTERVYTREREECSEASPAVASKDGQSEREECSEASPAVASKDGRGQVAPRPPSPAGAVEPPGPDEPMRAEHVFAALAERLPRDVVLVEETPSTRPDLHRLMPAREPRGFVSAAMGGLGFGLPAAAGLRMGDPTRPVVAVLGDGSSLYAIQGLWSAARYGCGVLFVVLANGRYAIMDRLAEKAGGKAPWPAFEDVDIHGLARSLGCPARRVASYPQLLETLDEVVPTLADRAEPLLLDVPVLVDQHFETVTVPAGVAPARRPPTPLEDPVTLLDPTTWHGKVYSDGWVKPEGGDAAVVAPATGEELGRTGIANGADIARASARAGQVQRDWAATSFEERAAVLRRAGQLWEERAADVEYWIVREAGSIPPKAAVEIHIAAQECYEAAGLASQPLGEIIPSALPRMSLARRLPVGVVGVIAPFNYPLILSIRSVAPALALGNAVVLKPDPRTAVSGGFSLARIFEEAGLPPGLLHVLPGGAEAGEALVADPNVRVISFTGSSAAGRKVGEAAGRHLKRAHLELGGNSALIVLDDADLDLAVSAGAWGSFLHQGQICMATGRHLVHHRVAEQYVAGLAEKANHLPVGDPAKEQVALGPIIDQRQRDKVHSLVTSSVDAGATLAAGGTYEGLFYRPTVLADVTTTTPAYSNEVFGPVAPVISFGDLDEAVALARDTEYGLSLGILSRDVMKAVALAERIPSGIVHINDQTIGDEAVAPFGGVGISGTGSRFGGPRANIDAFTDVQWLTMQGDVPRYPF